MSDEQCQSGKCRRWHEGRGRACERVNWPRASNGTYLHDIEELIVNGRLISVDDLNALEELDGRVKLLLMRLSRHGSSHATKAHSGHSRVRHRFYSTKRFLFSTREPARVTSSDRTRPKPSPPNILAPPAVPVLLSCSLRLQPESLHKIYEVTQRRRYGSYKMACSDASDAKPGESPPTFFCAPKSLFEIVPHSAITPEISPFQIAKFPK